MNKQELFLIWANEGSPNRFTLIFDKKKIDKNNRPAIIYIGDKSETIESLKRRIEE